MSRGWVEDIRGRVSLPQEQFDDQPHRKFDPIAVGLAAEKKPECITSKLGKRSPPA